MPTLPHRPRGLRAITSFTLLLSMFSVSGCAGTPAPTSTPTMPPTLLPTSTSTPRPISAVSPSSISLSGEWRFAADPDGVWEVEGWIEPGFDDSSWVVVNVPHTWNVMADYADYEGVAWYRRTFVLPAEAEDAHLRLRLDAVFYLARVWLNGEYLGEHEGG